MISSKNGGCGTSQGPTIIFSEKKSVHLNPVTLSRMYIRNIWKMYLKNAVWSTIYKELRRFTILSWYLHHFKELSYLQQFNMFSNLQKYTEIWYLHIFCKINAFIIPFFVIWWTFTLLSTAIVSIMTMEAMRGVC